MEIKKRGIKMKSIAISGASGFVGNHLSNFFKQEGYQVSVISRHDLQNTKLLIEKIEGVDALINLAGANILQRWSKAYKKVLYSSRIETTKALVDALSKAVTPPKVFISTSAVGIYKNDGIYDEKSNELADNFLANLCKDWEAEAQKANILGVRTVICRFGIIMGSDGGALQKMLLPFKLGLGGVIGTGEQAVCFIHIEDLKRFYLHAITKESVTGIHNMTTDFPTTNRGLTKALGNALKRPTLLPLPSFILKLMYGEGATVLTQGQTALPTRVIESGFKFKFEKIDEVLEDLV
jgi:hypothetical protein